MTTNPSVAAAYEDLTYSVVPSLLRLEICCPALLLPQRAGPVLEVPTAAIIGEGLALPTLVGLSTLGSYISSRATHLQRQQQQQQRIREQPTLLVTS